jgi:PAS domain S-box-containing protein
LLGIAALVLMAVVGLSYHEWRQYSRANADATQTRAIVASVDRFLASLLDAETGQRGFLLTGEERYLEPYSRAIQEIAGDLSALAHLLSSRAGQSASVPRLNALTADKLAELRETIELRRTSGGVSPTAIVLSDRGKQTMDEIRAICNQIRGAEISSQSQASIQGEVAAGTALLATIAGALVVLFLFAFGFEPFASPEPQAWRRSWLSRYGAAVLTVVAIALLRAALTPLIGRTNLPFTMFFYAVAFAAWFGGFRPAVLSIVLSLAIGAWFFAAPTGSLFVSGRDDQVAMLMIVVVGFGVALLSRSQRSAVDRAFRAESSERSERQRFETTLASIGDAVTATDAAGRVTFANKIALSLMRWTESEIAGKPLDDAFRIVNEFTRAAVESPVTRVLREGAIVGLANHTILIARDGSEVPIDDSAAPIRAADGSVQGTVLVFRDITDRRRAEATSLRLASIVDSSEDAIVSKDLNGIVTSWNKAAERILGYAADEMIGRSISVLAAPDRRDEMPEILERIERGERIEHYQTVRRRKDGTLIHVSLSVSPLLDASGRITGASKILRDITAQVRAQEEIAEQRERLRVTLRSIGDAVIATDTQGRVTYLNPVAEGLTGWASEDAAGRPLEEVFRIINEESRQTTENPVARVLNEGRIVGLANHTLLISRDGQELAIDDSAAPIRDARGEMMGVVLVFRDVSQKRAVERLAAEQAADLRQRAHLMERVPCFVRDLNDRIILWNPGAADLYGYSADEAVGKTSHSLLQTVFPVPLDQLRGAVFGIGQWDGELVHTRRDGERVTVASRWALHRDEHGENLSILEVDTDITERLELLATERALETERALRETEAELARVMRALSLGELASSIAHEVNQPIAGVVTNAEAGLRWLGTDPPSIEEARESLAMIADDGERAGEVIRRLREFLRRRKPEATLLDINEVAREAVALTRAELEKRRIEVRMELSDELAHVRGDRIQLQQVIVNLIMNGAEAMAATGTSKELVVTSRRSADGRILVAVRDSGVGISADDMPRMFDAFFTTKSTGMGMGLSISRSILEAHRGRIWANANDGPGLTVQFSLPSETAEERLSAASDRS